MHEKTQKKLREKAAKQVENEEKSQSFHPVINVKSRRNSSFDSGYSSASERLYADAKLRANKLQQRREELYSRSSRSTSLPGKLQRPAYERLYDLHRSAKDRQAELRAKVMQEEGVTFTPSIHLFPFH